jgi:hypothetical protein
MICHCEERSDAAISSPMHERLTCDEIINEFDFFFMELMSSLQSVVHAIARNDIIIKYKDGLRPNINY